VLVPIVAFALAAAPAHPDAGVAVDAGVAAESSSGTATPRRGSGPDKLPYTSDTIKEIVQSKQPEIERCWEQMLAGQDKAVEGRLQTRFIITPLGTVKAAKVLKKGTTVKSPELHRCVENVLSAIIFPKPPDGKDHPIEYPFNLKAVH
jgi:hypothetical protein